MKLSGRIHEVTNMEQFAVSYLLNPKKPKSGTFKAASGIKLHLASIIPGFAGSFMPSVSVSTHSASDGKFEISLSDAQVSQLSINKMVYIVGYRSAGTVNIGGHSVAIYEPVYRSQSFDITKYKSASHDIYFAPYSIPESSGITQKQVDKQISDAKKKFKDLEGLSGTIADGKVHVKGSGRGAEIKFNIELSPSTSFDLDRFIRGKVKAMDIDLPGPDFIVGICVSKDDIEKEVEEKIAKLMKEVNANIKTTLVAEVAKQTGQNKSLVEQFLNTQASVTFTKLRFPVVETKKIKVGIVEVSIPVRSVVPKLSIGFPRVIG